MAHSHSKYECVSLLYVQCMQLCGALQRTLITLRVKALSHNETIACNAACKRCNQCDSHLQRCMQRCRIRINFHFWNVAGNVACNTCKACHTKQFYRCMQRCMQCFIVRQRFKGNTQKTNRLNWSELMFKSVAYSIQTPEKGLTNQKCFELNFKKQFLYLTNILKLLKEFCKCWQFLIIIKLIKLLIHVFKFMHNQIFQTRK